MERAEGAISEVSAYQRDRYLLAPCDGEVAEIFAKRSDLIGTGSPVLSIVDMSDVWIALSLREDKLKGLTMGDTVKVTIPALGERQYKAVVKNIKAMASYAVWRATKINGQYDVKSFDIKLTLTEPVDGLRPGMTALLVN